MLGPWITTLHNKVLGSIRTLLMKLADILDDLFGRRWFELQLLLEEVSAKLILDVPHVPLLQAVVLGIMLHCFNTPIAW